MDKNVKKIIAVAMVMLLMTVAVGIGEANNHSVAGTNSVSIISRVNTEGSSVFISDDYMTAHNLHRENVMIGGSVYYIFKHSDNSQAFFELNADGTINLDTINKYKSDWGGMVFGTPGKTSIQHKMLQLVVDAIGLKFVPNDKSAKQSDTVYYDQSMNNVSVWNSASLGLDGGTVWQPVCGAIESQSAGKDIRTASRMYGTEQVEPGHACCVIAGINDYLYNNEELVVRFLAAYIESVNLVNDCISNPTTAEYSQLVELAVSQTKQTEEVVKTAMNEVNYAYGLTGADDTEANALNSLRTAAASLATVFSGDTTFKNTVQSLGYADCNEFANAFVNDYYMSKAIQLVKDVKEGKVDPSTYGSARIKIAVINGDIHQIALHFGNLKNLFSKYRVSLTISTSPNGGGVATSIQNGAASLGIMGLPPITITTVNSSLNTAKDVTVSGIVTDVNGNVLADKDVKFTPVSGTEIVVKTGSDGTYKFTVKSGAMGTVKCGDKSTYLSDIFKEIKNCDMDGVTA